MIYKDVLDQFMGDQQKQLSGAQGHKANAPLSVDLLAQFYVGTAEATPCNEDQEPYTSLGSS